MILDRIENAHLYAGLHTRFAKAFGIFKDKTLPQKDDGKYAIDGDKIYYTIQRYTTKPMFSPQACLGVSSNLEAHRKYIDIQFLLSGVELLGYAPPKSLTVAEEYNLEKDIAFFHTPKEITKIKLEPGLFCILFPSDAHLPCCQFAGPLEVRKAVIKVCMNGIKNEHLYHGFKKLCWAASNPGRVDLSGKVKRQGAIYHPAGWDGALSMRSRKRQSARRNIQ